MLIPAITFSIIALFFLWSYLLFSQESGHNFQIKCLLMFKIIQNLIDLGN